YGIRGVDQRHTRSEERRKDENRPKRQAFRCLRSRDAQHPYLGCGIETEAEQYTQRIHVPAARDHPEHRAEQACKKPPAAEQQVKIFFYVRAASPNTHEGAADRAENEEIDEPDSEQEEC